MAEQPDIGVCERCGAAVLRPDQHAAWHGEIDARILAAVTAAGATADRAEVAIARADTARAAAAQALARQQGDW